MVATEWWLTGLKTTLLVTVLALCIGVVLGLLIALIRSTHEQTGKFATSEHRCARLSDDHPRNAVP